MGVRGVGLNSLVVSFLQRINGVKEIVWTKDGRKEGVREVWETMGLTDMLS